MTTHLTPAQLDAFGQDMDAIRDRVLADLGERDTRYIRRVIRAQRSRRWAVAPHCFWAFCRRSGWPAWPH